MITGVFESIFWSCSGVFNFYFKTVIPGECLLFRNVPWMILGFSMHAYKGEVLVPVGDRLLDLG